MNEPVRVLFINGTVGAGKSTVADAVGDVLAERGVPHAVIDLDELRRAWPSPAGDRFNTAIELANLRSVAANYRRAGARMLVLAGVIEHPDALVDYREALDGVTPVVVRLTVDPREGERRLHARHGAGDDGLDWHLERHGELAGIIDAAGIPGPVIETTGRDVLAIALDVLQAAG